MKLACVVDGKPGLIVGYGPGSKKRLRAIVLTQGQLKDFALKDIVIEDIPAHLRATVTTLSVKSKKDVG